MNWDNDAWEAGTQGRRKHGNFDSLPVASRSFVFQANKSGQAVFTSDAGAAFGPDATAVAVGAISIGDAYFSQQWHLTGANGIGLAPGGTRSVWDNYSGKGVKIGIVDNGVQYTHKDLNNNYRTDLDWDARNKDDNAAPTMRDDNHGTAVAGVIGAEMNNDGNYGVVGVAWDSDLVGFRMGYGAAGSTTQILDLMKLQKGMDVSNNSWGYGGYFYDDFNSATFKDIGLAIEDAAINGRGGKGTVFVFAAGNDRTSGQNVNYHDFQNSPYVIAAAATDSAGKVAYFSTPGAAVLVSAPGVGIVTTDRTGKDGYVAGDFVSVSGTSFSTPIISGVVALMLEANPNLGIRDVQEILAYSARMTDSGSASWKWNGATNWNGGALHTSTDYGFGLVDAHAAVRLAETWNQQSTYQSNNVLTLTAGAAPGALIADNSAAASTLSIANAGFLIDRVEVTVDINHTWIGQLVVTLTHGGLTSVLVDHPGATASLPSGTSQDNIKFTMDSVQFWGENAQGDWTLTVKDTASGYTGTLNSWSLKFIGDADTNNDTYIYTDAYGTLGADPARSTLFDANGGSDTINLSAVTTDTILDMNSGRTSTIAGKSLVISGDIENAYLGDGNDVVRGNSLANLISGGWGNDKISGNGGADNLWGGGGGDMFLYAHMSDAGDAIRDFNKAQGDVINIHDLFVNIGADSTPWGDYLQFVAGADTQLQVDADGSGGLYNFATLTTLIGVNTTDTSIVSWDVYIA